MFRTALTTVAAVALAGGTASAETKSYDLSGFDSVSSSAGVYVEVTVGSDYSITLETNGDTDEAVVRMDGDTLVLSRERSRGIRLGSRNRLNFTVTMPEFEDGSASSGSELRVEGVSGGSIELKASSGANLEIEGTCDQVEAGASSGADLNAGNLVCDSGEASVSSGASVRVHTTDRIKARASSGGSVQVGGDPDKVDTKTSSGGSVRIR
ncbi:GIN domain-containing protein [Parvularcula maris]|uniref:DUF2807 domain-containing protein n=1 Tax=Parvularcula maris TaxID=2965077 RepID=A0A9X2RHK5_9PROT|nr:DUF2807 domain-containing protein [Parvularcula maris]MCQ8184006.1 DUF2807 domain-containing protein [Parvularcula maris]